MTINKWMASKKDGAGAATAFGDLAQRRSVAAAEMNAYQELKSGIHRKLIDRLDLSSSPRSPGAALGDHQDRRGRTHHRRGDPAHTGGAGAAGPRDPARDPWAWAPGAATPGSRDLRHHGQRRGECLHREHGKLHKTEVTFKDDDHLMTIIERIVSKVGGG